MQNFRYLLLLSFISSYMFAGESSVSAIQKQKAKWIRCDGRWKKDVTKEDLQSRLHHINMKKDIDVPYAAAIISVIVACQKEKPQAIADAIRQCDFRYRYDLQRYVPFGCGHVICSQLNENKGPIFAALLSDRPQVLHALSSIELKSKGKRAMR